MMIVHLTSVHRFHDTRLLKMVCSLASAEVDVAYVFLKPKNKIGATPHGVALHPVFSPSNRLLRMIVTTWHVFRKAVSLQGDVYHFHDPELIPWCLLLKVLGKRVIYDIHEDYPASTLDKEYLPVWARPYTAYMVGLLEDFAVRFLDGVIAATPKISDRFKHVNSEVVQNFPIVDATIARHYLMTRPCLNHSVCYVGGISVTRGIFEMLEAVLLLSRDLNVKLVLAGSFSPSDLEERARLHPGWTSTNYMGWLSLRQLDNILKTSIAGLVLFHPRPNHIESQPNKLFEYMSAGLPVIASDFPLWRKIVEGAGCGLLVDPLNPREIANAIEWLLEHPEDANEMGKRGRQAVIEKYNWDNEFAKLLRFYDSIMKS